MSKLMRLLLVTALVTVTMLPIAVAAEDSDENTTDEIALLIQKLEAAGKGQDADLN